MVRSQRKLKTSLSPSPPALRDAGTGRICTRLLLRVLWNLARDRKRRVLPAQLDEALAMAILSPEQPADQRLSQAADLAHFLEIVDRLPKLEKAVLLLTAFEEFSVAEITITINKSPSSVRSLTFRARTHLQERLQRTAAAKSEKGHTNAK